MNNHYKYIFILCIFTTVSFAKDNNQFFNESESMFVLRVLTSETDVYKQKDNNYLIEHWSEMYEKYLVSIQGKLTKSQLKAVFILIKMAHKSASSHSMEIIMESLYDRFLLQKTLFIETLSKIDFAISPVCRSLADSFHMYMGINGQNLNSDDLLAEFKRKHDKDLVMSEHKKESCYKRFYY